MKHKDIYPSKLMNPICEQAGCTDEEASKHAWKWERKRWHSHPIPTFIDWWTPHGSDPVSGASVGGHPEAKRIWAKKEPGKWIHRQYAINAADAWNTDWIVSEFSSWQEAGCPEKEDFVSIAESHERQKEFWRELKPLIAKIGKRMPDIPKLPDPNFGDPVVEN